MPKDQHDDAEMLDEYDFSGGVRGKYAEQPQPATAQEIAAQVALGLADSARKIAARLGAAQE